MFYGAPVTAPMEIPPEVYRSPNAPPMPELAELPAIEDAKSQAYAYKARLPKALATYGKRCNLL